MSRVKKVLASAMIVIMLVVMVVPATVSAKATRYCSKCNKTEYVRFKYLDYITETRV